MEAEKPSVRLRLNELCASLSAAMPLEKLSAGGPQFAGVLIIACDSRRAGDVLLVLEFRPVPACASG